MRKNLFLIIIIVLILTGCCSSKKEFRTSAYSRTYIKDTLNGKFWYMYAIIKEKDSTEPTDKNNYIVLRQSQDTPNDYVPMFRIPDIDYEYGDLILGDLEYMFLIKNNTIIRYQMTDGKRNEFTLQYDDINLLGIKENYLYFEGNNTYYKSDRDFKEVLELSENDIPKKYTFIPIA